MLQHYIWYESKIFGLHITILTYTVQASLSCKVILACRTQSKGEAAISDIKKSYPDAQLELVSLDLQSLTSVRKLAEDWESREDKTLDLLICNAGATFVDYVRTDDGFEQSYQVSTSLLCVSVKHLFNPCADLGLLPSDELPQQLPADTPHDPLLTSLTVCPNCTS